MTLTACGKGAGTPSCSATGSASLRWAAPATNTDGTPLKGLAGYRVYYGREPGKLDHHIEIRGAGATTWTVSGLTSGTWYFAITAVADSGSESTYSVLAAKTIE